MGTSQLHSKETIGKDMFSTVIGRTMKTWPLVEAIASKERYLNRYSYQAHLHMSHVAKLFQLLILKIAHTVR